MWVGGEGLCRPSAQRAVEEVRPWKCPLIIQALVTASEGQALRNLIKTTLDRQTLEAVKRSGSPNVDREVTFKV